MPNSSFSWGIIAPGRIARTFAKAVAGIDGANIRAVASRERSSGEAFLRDHTDNDRSATVYTDEADLIADPQVDAVYIASPHRFHADSIARCLDGGKPVLCEKPMVVSARQAETLFEIAERRGVFLMEALWSRFLPVWQQVEAWLDAGAIGTPHSVQSDFCFRIPFSPKDRLWDIEQAGGVTLDMGVYPISLSNFIFGRGPDKIQSAVRLGKTGVDVRTSALLSYGNAVSTFTCSFLGRRTNQMRIEGDAGAITIADEFWTTTEALLKPNEGESQPFSHPHRINGFEYQIEAAMADIRAGRLQNARNLWSATLSAARVMDKILADGGMKYPFL